jgi:hypothetical protein
MVPSSTESASSLKGLTARCEAMQQENAELKKEISQLKAASTPEVVRTDGVEASSSLTPLELLDKECSLRLLLEKLEMPLDVLKLNTQAQMLSFMQTDVAPMLAQIAMDVLERTGLKAQGATHGWESSESTAVAAKQSTRAKFRQTVERVVGARPKDHHWREDYPSILRMGCEVVGRDVDEQVAKYGTLEMLHEHEVKNGNLESTKAAGFTDDEADCLLAVYYLPPISAAIGKALQEGGTVADRKLVAAAVHTLNDTLTSKAREGKVQVCCVLSVWPCAECSTGHMHV